MTLAKHTYISERGNQLCAAHHWIDNDKWDCRACVWDFERASRNIAFALGTVAACDWGRSLERTYFNLNGRTSDSVERQAP